ncbi:hypothetical protein [Streptomyces sp. NPDC005780]|uniref:hypothetical protein n=1 Tax=Streptomyces sp. NPDC005780 TaxID=3364730 RepID=UPI0036BA175B
MIAQALALKEERRAEKLVGFVAAQVASNPNWESLPLYRVSIRTAFEEAAAHAEQPDWEW